MTSLLTTKGLAERWEMSTRTLEAWRAAGEGPPYVKLGYAVRYRLADIEAWEESQLRVA